MMQFHVGRRARRAAIASALFLALGSTAFAHGPGKGPYGHHGGPHHGGPERVIAQLQEKLGLDTSQQVMFDNAVAATRSAREAGRAEIEKVRNAAREELAKPEPDLAALAAIADASREQGQAIRRQVRDEWLKLYATFTPQQKAVVRDALAQRLDRFERWHERAKRGRQG